MVPVLFFSLSSFSIKIHLKLLRRKSVSAVDREKGGKRRTKRLMVMSANSSFLTLLHPEKKEEYSIERNRINQGSSLLKIIWKCFNYFLLLGTLLPSLLHISRPTCPGLFPPSISVPNKIKNQSINHDDGQSSTSSSTGCSINQCKSTANDHENTWRDGKFSDNSFTDARKSKTSIFHSFIINIFPRRSAASLENVVIISKPFEKK